MRERYDFNRGGSQPDQDPEKRARAKNQKLAGRSPRRLVRYGYHWEPNGRYTRNGWPSATN
jgi:hypothetical protein